ncbi:MAG: DUF2062 domain-containing protein [Halofilum sp. (in: g-proteobacteria)]|nr:DUF2062 domain-containing protein [Halofilum sp. (in: g-proteobacteria)]
MPKNFFRRYLPKPAELREQDSLRIALGDLLHDPNVWHLNRRSVSGGFAVGLFTAWIPLPLQMLIAAALALLLRVNLPLSVVLVWITNPLTMGPMFWFAWRVGSWLLGIEHVPVAFEPTLAWFTAGVARIWLPLTLGCLLLGIISAALGFLLCRLAWRYHVISHLLHRRRRRDNGDVRQET